MKRFAGLLVLGSALASPAAAAWTLLSEGGPQRHTFASALDTSRGELLVFGGSDGTRYRSETYAYNLATGGWRQIQPLNAAPSPRRAVEGVYDPVNDRLVVFGGMGDDGFHADVWALSLSGSPTWSELLPHGPRPSPRAAPAAVYDTRRQRMLVFGGYDPTAPGFRWNDLWALSLSGKPVWRRLSTGGIPPAPLSGHSAAYDALQDRMLVFGGGNQVWTLSLQGRPTWTRIVPSSVGPAPRDEQAAVFDPVRQRLIVFWGYAVPDVDTYLNDTWILSLTGIPTWTLLPLSPEQPYPRWGQGAIYDPWADRVVSHGGQLIRHETWALPLGQ